MICLMESHDMCHLVEDGPGDLSVKINKKYDSLLKGWIFGSVSEDVLRIVVDPTYSAQDVWKTLKVYFDSTKSSDQRDVSSDTTDVIVADTKFKDKDMDSGQSEANCDDTTQTDTKDSAPTKVDGKTEMKNKDVVLGETITNEEGKNSSVQSEIKCEEATQIETKDSALTKADTKTETKYKNVTLEDLITNDKWVNSAESEAKGEEATQIEAKETETNDQVSLKKQMTETVTKRILRMAIDLGNWDIVFLLLISDKDAITEQINSDGNTALHIAVGISRNDIIKAVLWHTNYDFKNIKNLDGSTLLHIAAIVGNTDAAGLLIKKDKGFLNILDEKKKTALDKAYENMHLDTTAYLLDAVDAENERKSKNKAQVKNKSKKAASEDRESKVGADGDGKRKKEPDDHGKGMEEPEEVDRKIKKAPIGVQKNKEAAHGDGGYKEAADDHGKIKEGADDDRGSKEGPDNDVKGEEAPDVDVDGEDKDAAEVSNNSLLPHMTTEEARKVQIGVKLLVNAISAKEYSEYPLLSILIALLLLKNWYVWH
ncbi:putative ankyrin repeat-containing domain-containing protein [Helianthus annuus]|nr:putative ankyrin repeat-containing domain-containing protein [Helianthus annuus]